MRLKRPVPGLVVVVLIGNRIPRGVRQRIVLHDVLRDRIEHRSRNAVAGKRRTVVKRVLDGRQGAEITSAERAGRHLRDDGLAGGGAVTFKGAMEKELVFSDRPSQGSAVLVTIEGRLREAGGEKILGREQTVSVELKQAAVKLIRTRFGLHQHL